MIVNGWRPFGSVEEMNEILIEGWNRQVTKRDQVWHLGDFAMGSRDEFFGSILPRLNGQIHLITGNHDDCWSGNRNAHTRQKRWFDAGIASIQSFARRKIYGDSVMLSHFPYEGDHTYEDRYREYRLVDEGKPLLHGHVHDMWRIRENQINVGVDVWGWAPVHVDEIGILLDEFCAP